MEKPHELQTSQIINNKLVFEKGKIGFNKALSDGFFFLKMPIDINLESGDLFATNFYKDKIANTNADKYRGFKIYTPDKLAEHEGYYSREADQTEQFFLEQRFWDKIYPKELVELAKNLKKLSILILNEILTHLEIPENMWAKATGGCSNDDGMYHLTFNHFRPEKKIRGLNTHKDSGWITILRSLEPGLEAFINEKWTAIIPKPDCFIINFGCAFEILTQSTEQPVAAVIHRVVQQSKVNLRKEDRFSYALFADNSLDPIKCKGLYEYNKTKGLQLKMDFKTFLDNILKATYQEDTVGLY